MAEQEDQGVFLNSLKMNGKEIRDNRAKNIGLGAEMAYKSRVDSLFFRVNTLMMEQENALDLSPDNAFSFIKLSDFQPEIFADKDIEMSIDLRNATIKFLVAVQRFEKLFGKEYLFTGKEEMVKSLSF